MYNISVLRYWGGRKPPYFYNEDTSIYRWV